MLEGFMNYTLSEKKINSIYDSPPAVGVPPLWLVFKEKTKIIEGN